MQAFAGGAKIEFRYAGKTAWEEVKNPVWNWFDREYRIKVDLPRTWAEFCKQHYIEDEYYIDKFSITRQVNYGSCRREIEDANCLKTKEDAEGLLALIKLKRLRDAWWGDWRRDLESYDQYCIYKHIDTWEVTNCFHYKHFLVFETKEIAEDFLSRFRDLIEKAEMWL